VEIADLGAQVLPVAYVDESRKQEPILIVELVILLYRGQPVRPNLPFL
jgi:hypothetical protein